jgi:prepilin-type N-terminal cleavage/methylation domain-containing protein
MFPAMVNKKIELEQQNTCSRGFTLVEMAVVLVIIGFILSAGLKVASSVLSSSASSSTISNMNVIKQSLVSYLRSNGKLPCPDSSPNIPTGISSATTTGTCSSPSGYGVVPWVTLGLSRDIALDGFGNFINYRVSNKDGSQIPPGYPGIASAYNAQQNWTDKTAANSFTILNIQNKQSPNGNKTIEIQGRDETTGAVYPITYNAIVVLFSHGKNGYGAKTVKGTTIDSSHAGGDETMNNTNLTTFIVRNAVDSSSAPGGAFDDVITYMTPNDLLQPLLSEHTLAGTCTAYCPTQSNGQSACLPPPNQPAPLSCSIPSGIKIPVGATPATCPCQ